MGCVLPSSLAYFSPSPASSAEVPHVWTTVVQILRHTCTLPSATSSFTAVSVPLHHDPCSLENHLSVLSSNADFIPSSPHLSHVCSAHGLHFDFISPEVIPFSKLHTKYCNSSALSPMIHCNSSCLHLPCWPHFHPQSQPPSDSYSLLFCLASVFPVMKFEVRMPSGRGVFLSSHHTTVKTQPDIDTWSPCRV